ncbi:RtcB family protein [Pseudomonas sp. PSE14]|uniref:RtcB family protein n=1 Tax=Pseudomonas sp. PSE14 TaxID=3016341 RepID=UPI0023D88BC0|nr:RtcB family protein [Pseudomonas sp. PSE14]WEJ74422.1 RtcB family protein [Pseudomonas sp. PSE14]
MNKLSRLQKAFLRSGIQVERQQDIITLTRSTDSTSARVLLPASFPLEEKAVRQLLDFASVQAPDADGHVCKACATPDFHPGSIAPVGSIVASTEDFVIPAAIGTDINCGMRLLRTGISLEQAESNRQRLVDLLTHSLLRNSRDVPMKVQAFEALFAEGPGHCLDLLSEDGLWANADRPRLFRELNNCIGLQEFSGQLRYAPEALRDRRRTLIRDPSLGTTGSGNHFVELQLVDRIIDRKQAYALGLKPNELVIMIHSGSRDVGFHVGQRWMDRARDAWPKGRRHPASGLYALTGELAGEYLAAMGVAARYAWLNRVVLAELVRKVLRETFQSDDSALIVDVPHNVVLQEQGLNIHRKGATPARAGDLLLIPGSMGDYSYLASGLGNPDWLWSCSHGAGRSLRRQAVRALKTPADSALPWHCVTLREERRIEEAPSAYKPVGPVIEAQEEAGLISPLARMRPWLTFKA